MDELEKEMPYLSIEYTPEGPKVFFRGTNSTPMSPPSPGPAPSSKSLRVGIQINNNVYGLHSGMP